jgi:hypothetical protein
VKRMRTRYAHHFILILKHRYQELGLNEITIRQ